jgi:hypothetical protein
LIPLPKAVMQEMDNYLSVHTSAPRIRIPTSWPVEVSVLYRIKR